MKEAPSENEIGKQKSGVAGHTHRGTPREVIWFLSFTLFFETEVSLCSFCWPGTLYVDNTGLELTDVYLPLE